MPTGNAMVDRAIEAHGGEDRFRQMGALDLTWTFHGMMFKADCGKPSSGTFEPGSTRANRA